MSRGSWQHRIRRIGASGSWIVCVREEAVHWHANETDCLALANPLIWVVVRYRSEHDMRQTTFEGILGRK